MLPGAHPWIQSCLCLMLVLLHLSVQAENPALLALTTPSLENPKAFEVPTKSADDFEFDGDFLRGKAFRNLDAVQIKNMNQAPEGLLSVEVFRGDLFVSKTTVLFKRSTLGGPTRPCINLALVQQLGLNPRHYSEQGLALASAQIQNKPTDPALASACLFMEEWVTGAYAQYESGELRLIIYIPQAYLSRSFRQSVPPELLTHGETAGFATYNFNNYQSTSSQGLTSNSQFLSLNSGLNMGDWRLRQSNSFSHTSSGTSRGQGELVVKRTLIGLKATMAVGSTSTNSNIIGSTPLMGVRLSTEEGLIPDEDRSYRPQVRGVARTNARVSIRQNNLLFFEQNVPPGPFEFLDINPTSTVGDLQVTVSESDGSTQSFTVPYSNSYGKLKPGSWRYSLSAGNYHSNSSTAAQPGLVHGMVRYGLNDYVTPTIELLLSQPYQAIGLQTNFNSMWGNLFVSALHARTVGSVNQTGQSYRTNYATPLMGSLGLYVGMNYQTEKFLSAATGLGGTSVSTNTSVIFKQNQYIGASWNLKPLGSINLSLSQQANWNQSGTTDQVRVSYGTSIKGVSLSLSVDHAKSITTSNDTVALGLSFPLNLMGNSGGVSASVSQTGNATPTQALNYFGSAETYHANYGLSHVKQGIYSSSSASGSIQHPWGILSGSLTSGNNSQQSGLTAMGSVVGHSGGVLLAPVVSDTFGILDIPNGEGVELQNGTFSRVDRHGFGVVPYLTPYALNDVEVTLRHAPLDLEIENTSQKVAPMDGAIVRLKFNTNTGKATLIQIVREHAESIPIGASVLDETDQLLGSVGQGSRAFVRLRKDAGRLKVVWGESPHQRCEFNYNVSANTLVNPSGFITLKSACDKTGLAQAISVAQE